VATIPTANGLEDVVMRLLASAKTLPLEGMGMQPDTLQRLKTAIERPYGMVLCVGPTGSGKTTTLHAALGHINTPERKIWTAEDPVEITQPGLRQVQVNPKIDWTFAKALRAFLRADPDVVMVGEIRDAETAGMAVEASLTGHLVMSTLHTNSAPETVTRLLDMGMDPFSFADSLLAVLAQRLVRRLCKHCVTTRPATPEDLQGLVDGYLFSYPDASQRPDADALLADWTQRFGVNGQLLHHHAPGCPHCDNSGYSRPRGPARAAGGQPRTAPPDPDQRPRRAAAAGRHDGRHAHPAPGRHPEGAGRADVDRGSARHQQQLKAPARPARQPVSRTPPGT
jgi:type II secretory ATPase GspE/PulE/Tfp pilus assembly ATPase PilB-like protein